MAHERNISAFSKTGSANVVQLVASGGRAPPEEAKQRLQYRTEDCASCSQPAQELRCQLRFAEQESEKNGQAHGEMRVQPAHDGRRWQVQATHDL